MTKAGSVLTLRYIRYAVKRVMLTKREILTHSLSLLTKFAIKRVLTDFFSCYASRLPFDEMPNNKCIKFVWTDKINKINVKLLQVYNNIQICSTCLDML